MNLTEAVAVLRRHNQWRRATDAIGDDVMPAFDHHDPAAVGKAIDVLTEQAEIVLASLRELQSVAHRAADPANDKALPANLVELAVAQMKAETVIKRATRV